MLIETALALVDQLVYKPGYKLSAVDHTSRFEGTIKVRLDYTAPNTDRENAARGYADIINTYAEFPIAVGDLFGPQANICLYRRIIDAILVVEEHEAREALRVAPTLWSPFHPHHLTSMDAWQDTHGASQRAELYRDFQFGIA